MTRIILGYLLFTVLASAEPVFEMKVEPPKPDTIHLGFSAFGNYYTVFGVPDHDFSEGGFSFSKLKGLIESEHLTSIDALFKRLGKSKDTEHEGLMASFSLVYDSQSTESAKVNFDLPRILLHKDRMILATTGQPDDQTLKTIEYEPQGGRFHFRQIKLGEKTVFDEDDTKCKSCHGETPRPLWGAYDLWPGAYRGAATDSAIEKKRLTDFLKSAKDKERYRNLQFSEETFLDKDIFSRFQNTHLFVHLNYLNDFRILKLLRDNAHFDSYKYAILAAFVRCDDIDGFLTPGLAAVHKLRLLTEHPEWRGENLYDALLDDTRKNLQSEYDGRIARYNQLNATHLTSQDFEGQSADLANADVIAKLRYLVEGQGVDMRGWSLSFPPGPDTYSYQFGVPGSGFFTVYMLGRDLILPAVEEKDSQVKGMMKDIFWPSWEENRPQVKTNGCRWLKKKSLSESAH